MADAETILRELLNKIALKHNFDEKDMTIKAINSGGANYTSVLFLVSVKVPGEEDIELFAKVACIPEHIREMMPADRMFFLESFFYNKLMKTYRDLEQKEERSDEGVLPLPKFYGCNTNRFEESVVLENLVAAGFGNYDRFISVDWDHAASSIASLAKFHALSFAYQKEYPEDFEEICKDLKYVPLSHDEESKEVFKKFIDRAFSAVKDEYKPRIAQYMEKFGEDAMTIFMDPVEAKVITHGDYRPSNLLYKREDDKIVAIPVDYQTIHIGSPASDILYFELCGTDSKFRAEYHDRLIDHYYNELSKALQWLGVDPDEVYPREMLDREMKQLMPFLVALGMIVLPIVLVEAEQAPQMGLDIVAEDFIIPTNDLYTERFAEIIEECVQRGDI